MAAMEPIDLELLRGPLPDGTACGVDLRVDDAGRAAWAAVREARDDARRIERDADQDRSVERSAALKSWEQVAVRSADILTGRSRDLGAAAALIEAWTRLDGFAGLAAGCDVARTLVEAHWADLFPIPDPDDGPADEQTTATERSLPLVRLVGDESEGLLFPAIVRVPLVEGRDGEGFGLCHWRSSRDLKGVDDLEKLKTALERGGTSPEQFQTAVAGTGKPFLQRAFSDLRTARTAWDALADAVATASGELSVIPKLPLQGLFEECEAALQTFAPEALANVLREESADMKDPSPEWSDSPSTATPASGSGPLAGRPATRDDALRLLEAAAEFFERNDPHSLVAAQVKNVVRMARLPATEYYRELIREDAGLQALARMVGLPFDG